MDFLIGVMLVIIVILLLINFTNISISDTKFGNSSCSPMPNYLITTMQNNQLQGTPSPVNAGGQLGLTAAKVNNGGYNYNYSKYFFIS
jgi:hypothetical protein